jgi:hypothetical protein
MVHVTFSQEHVAHANASDEEIMQRLIRVCSDPTMGTMIVNTIRANPLTFERCGWYVQLDPIAAGYAVAIQAVRPDFCATSGRFLPEWHTFDHTQELLCFVFFKSTGARLGIRCGVSRE